ncbi:MAG: iron ABC transporter substrate-binding protein [Desulfobacteraceae bacterium]|jgi:iron complex transport system substrate-binding protein
MGLILVSLMTTCIFAQTVTITDMAQRNVIIPVAPERIICIGPGTLRLIVYLQATEKVVGVEDLEKMNPEGRPYWLAHPEMAQLPRCGPGGPASINKKPDLESVLQVSPQVIFVTYMDTSLADEVQKILGIPVVVLSYGSFATFDETVFDALRIAGTVLKREQRAEGVINFIETQREILQQYTSDIENDKRPKVYVGGIGFRGTQGIQSSEQNYAPIEWVNAHNLAKEVKATAQSHVFVNRETLLQLNPKIIFIDGGGLDQISEDYTEYEQFYRALTAVENRRVFSLLPFNWYTTNIDTALCDAYAVGKILYPERFSTINLEEKADEIYTFMVGRAVYSQMQSDYGAIGQQVPFLE